MSSSVTGVSLGSDMPGPPRTSRRSCLPCGSVPSGNSAAQCPSAFQVCDVAASTPPSRTSAAMIVNVPG